MEEDRGDSFANLLKPGLEKTRWWCFFKTYLSFINSQILIIYSVPTIVLCHNKQFLPSWELTVELRRQITHQEVNIRGDRCCEKWIAGQGRERRKGGWGWEIGRAEQGWVDGADKDSWEKSRAKGDLVCWTLKERKCAWQKEHVEHTAGWRNEPVKCGKWSDWS